MKLVQCLAALAACAICAPAAAGNYLSLAVGQSTVQDWNGGDLNFDGSVSNISDEDTDTSFRIALGFAASDNLAFEIGYVDLGEATADGTSDGSSAGIGGWSAGPVGVTAAVDGYDLGFSGRMPTSETFALTARVGVLLWDLEVTVEDGGSTFSGSDDGNDVYFGLGAELSVSPTVGFRGDFIRYSVDDIDIDSLSLSAVIRFEG